MQKRRRHNLGCWLSQFITSIIVKRMIFEFRMKGHKTTLEVDTGKWYLTKLLKFVQKKYD